MFNRLSDNAQCLVVSAIALILLFTTPERAHEIIIGVVIICYISTINDKHKRRLKRYIKHCDNQYNEKR